VQSRFIYERIRTLATEKSRKVFVFIEDVGASGGYLLALAGDEIYADASSIVGSIGVISGAFGFVEFINRLGIERRLYTAGEKKSTLDPFKPEDPEEVGRLKRILEIIHDEFIALVKERRGQKLAGGGHNLFTGEFWTGRQALELGLIDGIMDIRTKMRALYGEEVRLKLVSAERGLFRRRGTGVGGFHGLEQATNSAGGTLVRDAISALEERAMWAKYGL
jgi:serine protease SohB